MKKMVAIALIVFIVLFNLYALAESIDLSGFDDDALVNLLSEVQTEIVNRNIEKTASIKAGRYVGGKDVPVGAYILHCKTDDDHHGIVWLSSADDDLQNDYPSKLYEHISFDQEEEFYIEIEEGGILCVPFNCELTISGGVMFK